MSAQPDDGGTPGILANIDQIIKNLGIGILVTDAAHETGRPRIVLSNRAAHELTGYTAEELLGQSPIVLEGPNLDPALISAVRAHIAAGTPFAASTTHGRRDGSLYHVDWQLAPIFDTSGALVLFIWMQQDVTDRVDAEQMRDTLIEALHLSGDPIAITDENDNLIFVNRGFEDLSHYRADEVLGKPIASLILAAVDPATLEPIPEEIVRADRRNRFLLEARDKDGELGYLDLSMTRILAPGTGAVRTVYIAKDVTEMVLLHREVTNQARRDTLTGLLNRLSGEARFEAAIGGASRGGHPFCAIMGDLDHFKVVNDTWGHPVGDRVLVQSSAILTSSVRPGDAVIRWGGEEFLILLEATELEEAADIAERIRHAFETTGDAEVGAVTISLGVAQWSPGESLASLISRVDQALYAAKSGGRNRVSRGSE